MKVSRQQIFVCLLMQATMMLGQSPANGANWQRVQQLPAHTKVHISADTKGRTCSIESVTDDSLTCGHHAFAKSEIKSIKLTRYAASTAAGAAIGAGGGAAIGAGIAASGDGFFTKRETAGVLAVIGVIPGALIGWGTDFAKGPTVYRRP
jgi:hypothetical protein